MGKTLNIVIIGLLAMIIFIQLTCNKPAPAVYPDYSERLKSIQSRIDSLENSIKLKEFKNEQITKNYITQFYADTSSNADTIYARFKSLLDKLGQPRFN